MRRYRSGLAAALTIGTFDGVHIGHRELAQRARAMAGASGGGARAVALVFDPNPLEVLRPGSAPARLSTFEQRERWLREAGIDRVVRLTPTPELLGLSPREFIGRVVSEYGPVGIVEGRDFRFGRGRSGDVATLADLALGHGFAVEVVEPVTAVLGDHSVVTVSSTMVRWLVRHGRVRDAAGLLGRPYALAGEVVRGDRRGRGLGFPTANLRTPCLLPADGVYAGRARVADGRVFATAVHVGERATFNDTVRTVEAFLMGEVGGGGTGQDGAAAEMTRGEARASVEGGDTGWKPVPRGEWAPLPGLPEYGWAMELELLAWLRDQVKFESVEKLVEQMERDCGRALEIASGAESEVGA